MRHSHSVDHGISRSTGKRLADAAGADNAHHRAGKDGHQNCRAGRKGQESV